MEENKEILLSVIIPMYNCGPVITRCLDSIDYQEADIIVVDDGSMDDSANIVREYQVCHPNVRLISKENGGPASARNKGIVEARGTYIMFVDADDYLLPNGIERLLKIAVENNADVLKYKVRSVLNTDPQYTDSLADVPISVNVIKGKASALNGNAISDYHVVDGLFRRSLIQDNSIFFKEDLFLREDDVFMCEVYCHTSAAVRTDLPMYCYVRSSLYSNTLQGGKKAKKLVESELKAITYRMNLIKSLCPDQEFEIEHYKYMRYVIGAQTLMMRTPAFTRKEYLQNLKRFEALGCWPISSYWLDVAGFPKSPKWLLKTYICNHPYLALLIRKIRN